MDSLDAMLMGHYNLGLDVTSKPTANHINGMGLLLLEVGPGFHCTQTTKD